MLGEAKKLEIKAEKMWYEEPHTRENRYRVRKNIGRILNIFDDLSSLNKPRRDHGGCGGCCNPNIDIENYYPWSGRRGYGAHGGFKLFFFQLFYIFLFIFLFSDGGFYSEDNSENGRGRRDREGKDDDMWGDRFTFGDGFPQIFDKNLRHTHYKYNNSKLLYFAPLLNSNGNEEIVFLFEDRIICTRANKINGDRFHYKNELLLSTGKLKFKKNAQELDAHSFLTSTPLHDSEEDDSRHLHKDNYQFEEELVHMEDKSESKFTTNESQDVSLPSRNEDRRDKSSSPQYFCFLVANGRKAKFFYARSKSIMDKWCKYFQNIVDKQNMSPN
jgi:hypothetical protein